MSGSGELSSFWNGTSSRMVPQAQSPWYIHDIQLIGILECPPEPHLRTQWSLYSYSLSSWGDALRTSCSWRCSVWVLGMPAKPTCSDQISNCCVAWICPCPSISKSSEYLTTDIQHVFSASHLEACWSPHLSAPLPQQKLRPREKPSLNLLLQAISSTIWKGQHPETMDWGDGIHDVTETVSGCSWSWHLHLQSLMPWR